MKKQQYEGSINPQNPEWKESPWIQLLIERYVISSIFCKGRVVLDSCCGSGWGTAKYIAPVAKLVSGFDLTPPSTTEPCDKSKCSFHTMDATKIAFKESVFEIVLALDSIEHMSFEDGLKYFKCIKTVLKDGGVLFGTTPLVEQDYLTPIFLRWNKFHIHMYTENDLKKALYTYFKHIKIYHIYNEVCPYFVFICSDNADQMVSGNKALNNFIEQNSARFSMGKIIAYRLWAKHLLKQGSILKALHYLLLSIKKNNP